MRHVQYSHARHEDTSHWNNSENVKLRNIERIEKQVIITEISSWWIHATCRCNMSRRQIASKHTCHTRRLVAGTCRSDKSRRQVADLCCDLSGDFCCRVNYRRGIASSLNVKIAAKIASVNGPLRHHKLLLVPSQAWTPVACKQHWRGNCDTCHRLTLLTVTRSFSTVTRALVCLFAFSAVSQIVILDTLIGRKMTICWVVRTRCIPITCSC